jgi:hypothetical protein
MRGFPAPRSTGMPMVVATTVKKMKSKFFDVCTGQLAAKTTFPFGSFYGSPELDPPPTEHPD